MSYGYAAAAALRNKSPMNTKGKKTPRTPNSLMYDHSASAYYLELKNAIYEGELLNYKREGVGILYGDEGIMYIGSWKNDQLNGQCIIVYPNGGYLYGNFERNKLDGIGVFRNYDDTSVVGYWKQSNLHGACFHFNTEKKIWTHSEYSNGLVMKYIYEERSITSDKVVPNIMQSFPVLSNALHDCFSLAIFHKMEDTDGILDGVGRINLDNGDIYDGFFRQGTFNGEGVYYNHQNETYIFGHFSENLCSQVSQRGNDFPLKLIREFKQYRHERTVYFFSGSFLYSSLKLNPQIFKEESLKMTAFGETQKQVQRLIADCNPNKKEKEREEYYKKYLKKDEKAEGQKIKKTQQEISEINVEEDLEIVEKNSFYGKNRKQGAGRGAQDESKLRKSKNNIKEAEKEVQYLKEMEDFTVTSKNNKIGSSNSSNLNSSRSGPQNSVRSKSRDRSPNASMAHDEANKSLAFELEDQEEDSRILNKFDSNKKQGKDLIANDGNVREIIPNFMSKGRDPMNSYSLLKQKFQSNKDTENEMAQSKFANSGADRFEKPAEFSNKSSKSSVKNDLLEEKYSTPTGSHLKNITNSKTAFGSKENQRGDTHYSEPNPFSDITGKVHTSFKRENDPWDSFSNEGGIPRGQFSNDGGLRKSQRSGPQDYHSITTSGISQEICLNKNGQMNPNESIRKPIFQYSVQDISPSPEKTSKVIGFPDKDFALNLSQEIRVEKLSRIDKEIREFSPPGSHLNKSLDKSLLSPSPSRKKKIFDDDKKNLTSPEVKNQTATMNGTVKPFSSPVRDRKKIFDPMQNKSRPVQF